jgi:hypothetical protein
MNIVTLSVATAEQIETEWATKFLGLNQEQRFALLVVAIGCSTAIIISLVGILSGLVSGIHRRRGEAELKRELIDRGMSAEEIARIVEAAQPKDFLERLAQKKK